MTRNTQIVYDVKFPAQLPNETDQEWSKRPAVKRIFAYHRKKQQAMQARVYAALLKRPYTRKSAARETAWHVCELVDSFLDIYHIAKHPDQCSDEFVIQTINNFLGHAPNHCAAAAKILMDAEVKDIFEVGLRVTASDARRSKRSVKRPRTLRGSRSGKRTGQSR